MSSRALRKLQKDELPGGDLDKESEGEASELSRGASANFNAFYLVSIIQRSNLVLFYFG